MTRDSGIVRSQRVEKERDFATFSPLFLIFPVALADRLSTESIVVVGGKKGF